MPHKRKPEAKQRRYISRLISKNAFRDFDKQESVNRLNQAHVEQALRARFGGVDYRIVYSVDKAEVLSDSRGQGTLQRVA